MTPGSANLNSVTTRSECSIRNAIESWSIKTQKRVDLRGPTPFCEKVTNTTQITFTFFANCSHEQDRTFDRYLLPLNDLSQSKQGSKTTAVVGNSRSEQLVVASHDGEVSVF